jgi:thioredoxin reductase
MYDVIIVGGGPAGLSAALILGRCRRRVLVCDTGRPRNARSHALHGFLTRDGTRPLELLEIARDQLKPYAVELRGVEVTHAKRTARGFGVILADGARLDSRKLLLATGVTDQIPELEGSNELYGTSVFHCPYCDGWEMRDQPLAVYGRGASGAGLSLSLKTWTNDVVLCSDGRARVTAADRERLARHQIPIREERIARLEGEHGLLRRIIFQTGEPLPRRGMFFSTGQRQGCNIAGGFGCLFTSKGAVKTSHLEETNIPGLYVAGDASRDVQLVIVAAAEGAKAGFAINRALQNEDFG